HARARTTIARTGRSQPPPHELRAESRLTRDSNESRSRNGPAGQAGTASRGRRRRVGASEEVDEREGPMPTRRHEEVLAVRRPEDRVEALAARARREW